MTIRRSGYIARKKRPPRFAKRRVGLDRLEREQMDDLARAVVMVRAGLERSGRTGRLLGIVYEVGPESLRWSGHCEECGAYRPLQWSHILGQGESPRMKWVVENAMAHCAGCHWTWTNRTMTAPRAPRLAKILAARCPCKFAPDAAAYEARLHALAAMVGQPINHAANRVAMVQWLKANAPAVLVGLAEVWERRAAR